jgi:hypothetical protein
VALMFTAIGGPLVVFTLLYWRDARRRR